MLGTFNHVTRANHAGTDWFNESFGPANTMQHAISVSGGSEMGNFLFSVNYSDHEGTLLNTFRERYTLRANTSFNLGDKFRIGQNLSYSVSEATTFGTLTEGGRLGFSYRTQP